MSYGKPSLTDTSFHRPAGNWPEGYCGRALQPVQVVPPPWSGDFLPILIAAA